VSLFYQHNIDETIRLAIWRIEEGEDFFLARVPLKKEVSHPYKRLQHLAGRYLLPLLFSDFPLAEIEVADTHKPFIPGELYHFSISHCGNYAAAIASSKARVGIDIELETPRIQSIAPKFLSAGEKKMVEEWAGMDLMHLQLLTLFWSAKEAIYKWHGSRQMDFKEHMYLNGPITMLPDGRFQLPFLFCKEVEQPLLVEARIFDPLILAWVVG
jgi:4'-phosphopantetheinyl transferase EntD